MNIKRLTYCLIFFVILFVDLKAQAPTGDLKEIFYLPSNDTLILNRQHSDWWFGLTAGANLNASISGLKLPEDWRIPIGMDNFLIEFPGGFGLGSYYGLFAEYLPIGKKWGASLKLMLPDIRASEAVSQSLGDSLNTKYKSTVNLTYLSIAPSARYNTSIEGLHFFGGLDLEINVSDKLQQIKTFEHTAGIQHIKTTLPFPAKSFRTAFHLGAGLDIFIMDFAHKARFRFTPNVSVHLGTSEISAFNSARLPFIVKLGATMKIGFDKREFDTLFYDPTFQAPPIYLASAKFESGVSFPGFKVASDIQPSMLALVEYPIEEELAYESEIEVEERVAVSTTTPTATEQRIRITPNQTQVFTFPTTISSALSNQSIRYLDEVAEYLRRNPSAIVRIIGHSDNAGTIIQNQQRSEARASEVVQYLMSKGITRGRLLDTGRGALDPVADNTTEAGRRQNRRVEITVVQ